MRRGNDFPWTCEVCGVTESAGATLQQSSSAWAGAFLSHKNPRVCADNLAAEQDRLSREREELRREKEELKKAS